MRLSKHSKQRIKERTNIKRKSRERFFRLALDRGLSLGEAINKNYDKAIINYLKSKSKIGKAKIYNNYIFIYSKNNKTLYTMYEIPDVIKKIIKNNK